LLGRGTDDELAVSGLLICTKFVAVMPNPATAAATSSRPLSTPALTVTEKTASSGCTVELCEVVTVTVLLASCASKGAADIKNKTMTRRRDIDRFYYAHHALSVALSLNSGPSRMYPNTMALDLCSQSAGRLYQDPVQPKSSAWPHGTLCGIGSL